jgi:hypothetical protein
MPEVFGIANEYWVSFWVNDVLYDKKFVFPAGIITKSNFKLIEQLGVPGVLLK